MEILNTIMMIFVIIVILAFVIFLLVIASQNSKAQDEAESIRISNEAKGYTNAKIRYFEILAKLKKDPNNPELKQETLGKGREFCAISREYQGQSKTVTVYDEMALMNDINAACAGASVVSENAKKSPSVQERLAKLSELKEKKLISENEYETRRQKILDEI